MSEYQNKSIQCKDAAILAKDNSHFAAVGHSAYYSCFLLMEHIWYYKMHKTKPELEKLCTTKSTGVHEVLFSEVFNHINAVSIIDSGIFDSKLLTLKRYRILADYTDKPFEKKEANNALSLMNTLVAVLNKYV